MNNVKSVIGDKYKSYDYKLEKDFEEKYENDLEFKKICNSLKRPKKELMKVTSKLEDSLKDLSNCKNCKNILECKNIVEGYVYYPNVENDNIVFSYVPCKYKKKFDKETAYQDNVYLFDMPKEIKNANMKDIYRDDKKRLEIIKWIKIFLDNYKPGNKGLYLTGNFGCGKTYLLSAMLNEIAKKGTKVAIIYFPEFLRKLKESFGNDEDYTNKFNYIKKVEILLIDDIGAETTTSWGRDEILSTILQYRMQEGLTTFFTSNLSLEELEDHFAFSTKGVEKIKARRIIERIKQLTEVLVLIGENKRK